MEGGMEGGIDRKRFYFRQEHSIYIQRRER